MRRFSGWVVLLVMCFGAGLARAQLSTPVQLLHPAGAASDRFGNAVAVDGDTLIVGAPFDDVGTGTDQGSAHIYRWTGSGWAFEATLTAADGAANEQFGTWVTISGETVIVGAPRDDVGTNTDQGSVYVFTRSGTTWTQQAKLTASDGATGDSFGRSVAIDGDTAIVGANVHSVGANAFQGAAYVFTRSGTTWTQQAKLIAADGAASDAFGTSVAISGDTAIVGANLDNVGANADQGSAYVFARSGTTWTQQAKLTASDGAASDEFGISVALSGDTAIVGAFQDRVGTLNFQGSACVFTRSGATWTQQAKLTATGGAAGDSFGYSVALSGDSAIVGAYAVAVSNNFSQGSAYVFTRSGITWTQQAKLTASDGAASDFFGRSVAIDGDIAIVGATGDDVGANTDQGAAWVFSRVGSSWIGPDFTLLASDGAGSDWFGFSVAIDGDTAIVGAYTDDVGVSDFQGSAYVFTRTPGGTTWTEQAQLIASDGAPFDRFGFSVAIDGNTVIVGAYNDDAGANVDQGSAYVFTRSGTTWTQQSKLTATGGAVLDFFGSSVALSGNTAIVGAQGDDVGTDTDQGSAYVFTRSGTTWTQQAQLTAADGAASDFFGTSVAISGGTAIVGAYAAAGSNSIDQGSAYVFTRSGAIWTQQAKLTASDGAADDQLGFSVAIDGDTAIVGANLDNVGVNADQGSAYVFTRSGTTWNQRAKLTASDGAASDQFGISVAVSGDTAIVGAYLDNVGTKTDQGSAYVFTRLTGGSTWTLQTQLTATSAGGRAGDSFGRSVALSGDTAIVGAYTDDVGSNGQQGSASMFVFPADDFAQARDDVNGISYPTLAGALLAASSGDQITATPAAWRLASTLDTTGRSVNLLSTSDVRMPSIAALTLGGSSSLASGAGEPIELFGTLSLPGSGTRIFNASRVTLAAQATLTAGANARMQMASGHFDVAINSNARFDLSLATLQFRNVSAQQTMEVMSTDIGPDATGLDRSIAGHNPIGSLNIGSAANAVQLALVDNHDNDNLGQASCEAIYVNELRISAGSRLINPTCRIYYNTLANSGVIDVPANVIQIATVCPADFNGDGFLTFEDFDAFVGGFESGSAGADFNGDGFLTFEDFDAFVTAFEAGC